MPTRRVLTAMLHNLMDNAVTFTHELAAMQLVGRAHAATAWPSAWPTMARGVAPADLARILEPFEHAGRRTAPSMPRAPAWA